MIRTACRLALPALASVALSGCLSHMAAKEDSASRNIRWAETFETARGEAASSGRPILAVLVAGAREEHC